MNATTFGVDIAKSVMQVHWVECDTGEIHSKKLSRAKFVDFFAMRQPTRVAMEACGGAHHWARTLMGLGHTVELLPARQVRAFVRGNKDDAADARAIWLAVQHADLRRVPVKSTQQQAVQFLHRMRSHWMSVRTASLNALRSMLYEFGVVLPTGPSGVLKTLGEQRAAIDTRLPAAMQRLVDHQLQTLRDIQDQVQAMEVELAQVQGQSEAAQRLRQVPGIGLLGATALAATLGDGQAWRNGREFSACLGLVPRHSGTGGKVQMGGISKRGDPYLRTLLISGARCLISQPRHAPWLAQMLQRRPANVVAVALANKLARLAWALVAHGRGYDDHWVSLPRSAAGAMPQA